MGQELSFVTEHLIYRVFYTQRKVTKYFETSIAAAILAMNYMDFHHQCFMSSHHLSVDLLEKPHMNICTIREIFLIGSCGSHFHVSN